MTSSQWLARDTPAIPDLLFDVGAAFLRQPSFALEHFEHGKLVRRKRVALDRLQMGSLGEPPVRSGGSGRTDISVCSAHGSTLPQFIPACYRRAQSTDAIEDAHSRL